MSRPLGVRFRASDPSCTRCAGKGRTTAHDGLLHAECFLEGWPVELYCPCSLDHIDPAEDGTDEQRAELQARRLAGSVATCRQCQRETAITDELRPYKFTFNHRGPLPAVEFDLAFICPSCRAWSLVPEFTPPEERIHPPRDLDPMRSPWGFTF